MNTFQWFLVGAGGCITALVGLILTITSYYKNDNCYYYSYSYGCGNNCYYYNPSCYFVNDSLRWVGTIVAVVGGVLALSGCLITTTKLVNVGQRPSVQSENVYHTEVEIPEIPSQSSRSDQIPVLLPNR